jgi:uncharacterized protein (TIGR02391 family)
VSVWAQIHPEIVKTSQQIAETGKFDDAIFAAFKFVEASIQERIGSTSIGRALIGEAFHSNHPKISISDDAHDRQGIAELFSGALGSIRNDRGHKKAPFIPCENLQDCFLYLTFASFLLYLLSKDKNTFPRVEGIRVFGTAEQPRAELRGVNFSGSTVSVIAGEAQATVVRAAPTVLEILLPQNFFGNLVVAVDGKSSGATFCDVSFLGKQAETSLEVIAAEVPLYSDARMTTKRENVVGLLLKLRDGGRELVTVFPTYANRYKAGQYVTQGSPEPGSSVGETWYADPTTANVEYAWTSSMIVIPKVVGGAGTFRMGGISILPRSVHTQIGENRCLRVVSWGKDGPAHREMDVTDRVTWKSVDPSVAFVRNGVVIPKKLGKASAECAHEGFVASVELSIEHIVKGQRTTYFQGLRRLQQIRFDHDDNLYICNQGPSVFRLDKTGVLDEVLRISSSPRAAAGIDSLALDEAKNLYVNDVSKRAAFKFEWDGKMYANPIEIGKSVDGPKKSLAVAASGDVFVAVMGPPGQGWIVRRQIGGQESTFPVKGMPIWLASGPDGNIYVPVAANACILVYRPDGALIDQIPYQVNESSVCDILVDKDRAIYLAFFHTGKILRIGYDAPLWRAEFLPHRFGTPGGIAKDSRGRLYVSDFGGDSIDVVY